MNQFRMSYSPEANAFTYTRFSQASVKRFTILFVALFFHVLVVLLSVPFEHEEVAALQADSCSVCFQAFLGDKKRLVQSRVSFKGE